MYAVAVLHLNRIVGNSSSGELAEKLHRLSHDGQLEEIRLSAADAARKRLRVETDKGTDCAIALNRDTNLENGSVLLLEDDRAIVVRMLETTWLRIQPRDSEAALELGYFTGNLHWRVRFDGDVLSRVGSASGCSSSQARSSAASLATMSGCPTAASVCAPSSVTPTRCSARAGSRVRASRFSMYFQLVV